jgi:protein SCO1/2
MKRVAILFVVLFLFACTEEKPKPLSEPGERLYTVRGIVLSRNAADNSLNLDHEEIPGFMTAMKMDYSVRGADVKTLPADRKRIEAKLHVTDRAYWLTDVKQIP